VSFNTLRLEIDPLCIRAGFINDRKIHKWNWQFYPDTAGYSAN